ncbi:MAG: rod shape-determining protein RodA, partial [Bacteroidales bacterium]|nr:rod shape-determining protein RodA [Bacteroidales bacterium]
KQVVWILTAFALAMMVMLTDVKFFSAFAYIIYGVMLVLLVSVLAIGTEIAGSKSWFQIGSFRLQPAEFAKFATTLALARYLSALNFDDKKLKSKIIPLVLMAIPALLILLQNDTGSAIVYAALVLVLYRQGMSGSILLIGIALAMLSIASLMFDRYWVLGIVALLLTALLLFIRRNRKNIAILIGILILASSYTFVLDYAFQNILEPHQRTRINVLLGKQIDLKGAGYNVNQSKIAIGSGGFTGKGFLKGTQTKFNFVPEQSTDFIFCTVGEEWGFLGTLVVISLFIYLCVRIVMLAERQRSDFSRIYGYGVASILFFHFFVNIGMTIGLMPVVGIPLPFYSYGGSSLWAFTILLFIFIKQDANRLQLV